MSTLQKLLEAHIEKAAEACSEAESNQWAIAGAPWPSAGNIALTAYNSHRAGSALLAPLLLAAVEAHQQIADSLEFNTDSALARQIKYLKEISADFLSLIAASLKREGA